MKIVYTSKFITYGTMVLSGLDTSQNAVTLVCRRISDDLFIVFRLQAQLSIIYIFNDHRMVRPTPWDSRLFVSCKLLKRQSSIHQIKTSKGNPKKSTQIQLRAKSPHEIRNIGVIAHVDAGKTTITERLLFLTGAIKCMGDVDSGTTVTDFMELERERGITIQSAAITFYWRNHRINLIDTPGHVDFTLEVERCVRVLDAAITVLDASAGVQAQTLNVWRQAKNYRLPSVIFINKMDKRGASFEKAIQSIKTRLKIEHALPITIPIFDESGVFNGVINLINKTYFTLNTRDGEVSDGWKEVMEANSRYDKMMSEREQLLSSLADIDEKFAEVLLNQSNGNSAENSTLLENVIADAIRRATLSHKLVPVTCGTALRSATSVIPVLDATVDYLPSPIERNKFLSTIFSDKLSALVFKISHDKKLGQLAFVRIYTGELKTGSFIYNATRRISERKVRVFIPHGDELQPSDVVEAGNIAIVSGFEHTITGDTIVESEDQAKIATQRHNEIVNSVRHESKSQLQHRLDSLSQRDDEESNLLKNNGKYVQLAGIRAPEPIFFCSIEAPNPRSENDLERALQEILKEDPSIRIRNDKNISQTIIEGMGELHVQIIKDRLKREYGLDVFMGPIQVSYKEILVAPISHSSTVSSTFEDSKMKHECTITLELKPQEGLSKFSGVSVAFDDPATRPIRTDWLAAINSGCRNALFNGPNMGSPMQDMVVFLKGFVASGGRLSETVIGACASRCVHEALQIAKTRLLEPVMLIEITIVDSKAKDRIHNIIGEIVRRRGSINGIDGESDVDQLPRLHALLPCSEIKDMVKTIRIISSGLADIHMQFEGYKNVSEDELKIIRSTSLV